MEKLTLQERLLDRSRRSKFNILVKEMNKAADSGLQHIVVLPNKVDELTEQLLKSDNIKVESISYIGYEALKISWSNGKEK